MVVKVVLVVMVTMLIKYISRLSGIFNFSYKTIWKMLNKNIPTFQLYNILTDLIDLRFADFQKQSVEVDKVIVPINFYPLPHIFYIPVLNLRTPN